MLRGSIGSLGRGDFEVLVGIDKDDPQKERYLVMDWSKNVRFFVFENPQGYGGLHEYYNELAREARGDWIMLWNDDAIMDTTNWINIFNDQDHTQPIVLSLYHEVNNLFPAISRTFHETIGHFSLQTHADSWVQQVGERSGTQRYVPGIKIVHIKPMDETGQASTQIAVNKTGPEFSSDRVQALINQDVTKIKERMKSEDA